MLSKYGQYVGMDVHKKMIHVTVLNGIGEKMIAEKIVNNISEIDDFTNRISRKAKIVMEACYVWQHIYDFLEEKGFDVTLAHPLKVKAIASARIKTDSIDSKTLADLLRADLIPEAYVPVKKMRELREFVRHRAMLVKTRTTMKNRIHSILARNGINHEFSDLFGKEGMDWLEKVNLSEKDRFAMDNFLAVMETLKDRIWKIDEKIDDLVEENKDAELLTSIPGLGFYSALLVLSEISDINRFDNPKKLCSYAGLVPSIYQSGNTIRRGKLTKQGSRWLRWIMVQAAHHAIRNEGSYLEKFYYRIFNKKGKKIAIAACARKLLIIVYQMLKNHKTYQEVQDHIKAEGNSVFCHGSKTR